MDYITLTEETGKMYEHQNGYRKDIWQTTASFNELEDSVRRRRIAKRVLNLKQNKTAENAQLLPL